MGTGGCGEWSLWGLGVVGGRQCDLETQAGAWGLRV